MNKKNGKTLGYLFACVIFSELLVLGLGMENYPYAEFVISVFITVCVIYFTALKQGFIGSFFEREKNPEEENYKKEVLNLRRRLLTFSECNKALIHATEEPLLLHEICRIIVKHGKYCFAWVGFCNSIDKVQVVAQIGTDDKYLIDTVEFCYDEEEKACEVMWEVIKTGKSRVIDDIPNSSQCSECPTRQQSYKALMILPLVEGDRIFGIISIYSSELSAFEEEEKKLLLGLSSDLAYGLLSLRAQNERKRAKEMVEHLAYYDPLTNLPNRILLKEHLAHALQDAERNDKTLGVLFINIDRLNSVNDTLGYSSGDQLIKSVTSRMKGCLRRCDIIGRFGGDEFVVILPQIRRAENAARLSKRLLHSIKSSSFSLGEHNIYVSASIGVAVYPNDAEDAQSLIKNADIAMRQVKEQGKSNYRLYTTAINSRAFEVMELENRMREALEENEFEVEYQPRVNVKTKKVVSMEALLRWSNPKGGTVVYPTEFIPVAEDSGIMIPLGEWVIKTACKQSLEWQKKGYNIRVSVNISSQQLYQEKFDKRVAKVLKDVGILPKFLELEVTESAIIKDPDVSIKTLARMSKTGIHISLDDFGAGYFSLKHMQSLSVGTLRVDGALIGSISKTKDRENLFGAITAMAHSLNIKVAAKSVETKEHVDMLNSISCDEIQGHILSPSLSPLEATKFLENPKSIDI